MSWAPGTPFQHDKTIANSDQIHLWALKTVANSDQIHLWALTTLANSDQIHFQAQVTLDGGLS